MKNYNFLSEDLVRNKMNNTNLEYIAIMGFLGDTILNFLLISR